MHTVHKSTQGEMDGIEYAALGIIFDTQRATVELSPPERQVIDDFFSSLQWSNDVDKEVRIDALNYGSLVDMVNTRKRYVYRGSVTTPPCARFVNWNVVADVYPIDPKWVDLFRG